MNKDTSKLFRELVNKHAKVYAELAKGPTPKITIPDDICIDIYLIYSTFKKAGFDCYLVGGCVRDSLLGRIPKDWDMATNATTKEITELFKDKLPIIPTGVEFGTVTIMCEDRGYEVTTYRGDMYDSEDRNFHHPTAIEYVETIEEDLSRRDFTINAMAYDINDNIIIDPFGGQEDLQDKTIECVGRAGERFMEDPLRMLRAIRFSAQLGFKISSKVNTAIWNNAELIEGISGERKQMELNKILLSNPAVLNTFAAETLLSEIIPELTVLRIETQNNPYHIYDAFEHSIEATKVIEPELHLRLAMLLHDIGKARTGTTDENGIDHYYGHGKVSEELARDILKRLKYSNEVIDKTCILIKEHDRTLKVNKKALKKVLNLLGEEGTKDLLKVRWADICAQNPIYLKERAFKTFQLTNMLEEIVNTKEPFSRKDLNIAGNALMKIGFKFGPEIGEVLDYLLDMVQENPELNNYDKLEKAAKAYLKEKEK